MAYLKQCLEDKEVDLYAWIDSKEIVNDVLTKQGSKRDALYEVIVGSIL